MQKLFENWRRYVIEQDDIAEPDAPDDEPVDASEGRSPAENIEQLAGEIVSRMDLEPQKGPGVVVKCPGGSCVDQMIVNGHIPFWERGWVAGAPGIRAFNEKFGPDMGKKMYKEIFRNTGVAGIFGIRKVKNVRVMDTGGKRSIKFIVVHSSTTQNPFKTVNTLMRKGLSINYEIFFDGTIYEYFPPEIQTFHARAYNKHGIGIELTGNPEDHNSAQQGALKTLISGLVNQYQIPSKIAHSGVFFDNIQAVLRSGFGVFGHESVTRKSDPGTATMAAIGGELPDKEIKGTKVRSDKRYRT